jgi:hypothetical protein
MQKEFTVAPSEVRIELRCGKENCQGSITSDFRNEEPSNKCPDCQQTIYHGVWEMGRLWRSFMSSVKEAEGRIQFRIKAS